MRIHFCAVVLSGLLLAVPLSRAQEVQLLMTGQFHKGEVTAQSGDQWYGLFPEGNGCRLVRTTIQVTPLRDIVLDDKEDEKTGSLVACDQPDKPLFLVRGIPRLNDKPVNTVWQGEKFFHPGENSSYYLGGTYTGITASGEWTSPEQPGGSCFRNYSLFLSRGSEYRRLVSYEKLDQEGRVIPALLWAGDLDNDNKMDMFWDLAGHYYKQQFTLFLSSLAGEGEWMKKAAEFIHTAD